MHDCEIDKRMIDIYLYDPKTMHHYECEAEGSISFRDILMNLNEFFVDDNTVILERETEIQCDLDVSISALNVQNGMYFIVL